VRSFPWSIWGWSPSLAGPSAPWCSQWPSRWREGSHPQPFS